MQLCSHSLPQARKRKRTYTSNASQTCQRTAWARCPRKSANCKVCLSCLQKTSICQPALEIVLGAGDPKDAASQQVEVMGEGHVSLVKEHAFAGPQARTDLAGALVVVVLGGANEGEGR